jgi:hypothetical protein
MPRWFAFLDARVSASGSSARWAASAALLAVVTGSACLGNIGDPLGPDPDPDPQLVCTGAIEPGPSPIRRMTRSEYNRTVRDLLGDTTGPADTFGAEEEALGFNNNAASLTVSDQLANKYLLAAEGISERATDPAVMATTLGCDVTATGPDACAQQFIATFLRRAFRRPVTEEEQAAFFALYQKGLLEPEEPDPFRIGIELVIQAALQSPAFLYRVEMGLPAEAGATYQKVSHHEMASRLSYFLWGTMPDPELFAAAEAGQLGTKEEIEQQARRLLDDPRARDAIEEFHAQWLDYDRIGNITKDAMLFPDYSPAIGQMMREEMRAFVDHAVFEAGGDLATLLTAPYSYMPPELATFYGYGVPEGAPPGELVKIDFPPSERAGLLTLGALMTLNAHTNQTSPVHRGKLVREQFLCFLMPPPPPDVIITAPEPGDGSTAKERFAAHSEAEACSGCHRLMDGIGFGFENYSSIGRYQTMEGTAPIDASGTVVESDIPAFQDGIDLVNKMADSEDVQHCYVKQWFRFGYGRSETKSDACTMQALQKGFVERGGDIKELLVSLTQSDAFLYRRAGGTP